ncbi:alpha/beta fold hydrolase [Pontibacter sp. E15-1]|uniref:alpha/beta hydrolase family protein n=1 Tax=Pontibacter sp. E15-1 TaxID=2919918 RepID=UPI001F4F4DFD|nr:alpha/beta fold hydrolase [Pontibacter sp. E15-1]MCJ8164958.1 alpha/beta fold hydrolase [Pontibacter sp. E15-1]
MKVDFVVYPDHGRPFTADATYRQDGQPKPVVIFAHGFKGFKDWGHFNLLARHFAENDFVFLKFNFAYNGTTVEDYSDMHDLEAFGQNNFSLELDDMRALIELLHTDNPPLQAQELDLSRIYLIGHSRGGGAVILEAAEEPRVKAVATWAAVNRYDNHWDELHMGQWKEKGVQYVLNGRTGQQMPLYYQIVEDYLVNKYRLDIPTVVKRMTQPLLLLHGEQDETLPTQMALDLKSWKPDAELHFLPDTNHSFGGQHPYTESGLPAPALQAADLTIAFFRKHA